MYHVCFAARTARNSAALLAGAALLLSATLLAAEEPGPAPITSWLAAADSAAGENIYLQCSVCHVAQPGAAGGIGPNLWNVVGRAVASQPGFDYSESLKQVGGKWDYEKLNRYLFDPKLIAPEGRMPFPGVKDDNERANLIAYLRTLSDAPLPLPAASAQADAPQPDAPHDWDGLPPGPGREEVFYLCKACHSLMIVKQQGLTRSAWDDTLQWMVDEQGMRQIDDTAARNRLLDYLATHFGRD